MTQKQTKKPVEKSKKNNRSSANNEHSTTTSGSEDPRFSMMHKDPKFLPVEAKTVVNDPRLYEILDPSFTMLKKTRDASGKFKEQALKNTLKDIYNFEKDPTAMRVAKLKQAKKEMEEEEGKENDSDYDSDDSIEDAKEMIGKKDKKPLTASEIFEGDESEEEEEEEMDFDKFLESLEGRPELENVEWNEEWDDAYDFDDEDTAVMKAVGQEVTDDTAETIPEEQQDLWDKYVEDQSHIKMIDEGEETNRISVMNCDWNLVDSEDLFVLFSSMCPPSGKVTGVTIYLSDFGKQQRENESVSGPGNLFYNENDYKNLENVKKKISELKEESRNTRLVSRREKKQNRDDIKIETQVEHAETNNEMLDPVKVREYEFKKMKYYFAVIQCDSPQTATYLYNECDGFEFESTSILLDLRFIPDDLDFSEREVKSQCTSVPADYKPKQNMYSKPLKSSSVDLSWDTNDPEREVLKKDFKDVSEEALMKFIANSDDDCDDSSSSSDEEEETVQEESVPEPQIHTKTTTTTDSSSTEEKKQKKKEKKEKKKLEKKKYKDLIKYAKKKEKEKEGLIGGGSSEDASQNIEFVLHEGLKDTIQKEVVNKQKEKEKLENETWWETAERKRKDKKKQQRKDRLRKILNSDQKSDEEEQIDEDDLLGEQKLKEREKEKQKQLKEDEEKRKQNLELLMSDYNAEKGFDIKRDTDRERTRRSKKNQDSKKKKMEENENIAPLIIGDDRFADVFLDPEFHLDQTHPKYKKTDITSKIMEKRREESVKRQEKEESLYSSKLKKRKL